MERHANCNKREESHKQTRRQKDLNMHGNKGLQAVRGNCCIRCKSHTTAGTDRTEYRYIGLLRVLRKVEDKALCGDDVRLSVRRWRIISAWTVRRILIKVTRGILYKHKHYVFRLTQPVFVTIFPTRHVSTEPVIIRCFISKLETRGQNVKFCEIPHRYKI
jgi:hypothetical protein